MSGQQALLAAAFFNKEGYEPAKQSNILQALEQINPWGDTAMLSSMMACLSRILRLNGALSQIGLQNSFNFLHIVITDGVDNESRASIEQVGSVLMLIGAKLPVDRCKTIIIGIDLDEDPECRAQLDALNMLGGENCQKYDVDSVQMGQVFDGIKVSLGIQRQTLMAVVQQGGQTGMMFTQTARPVISVQRPNFAVLFNLDISGSMSGMRWNRVKASVSSFMSSLSETDLVSCVCFNGDLMSVDYAVTMSKRHEAEQASGGGVIIIQGESIACTLF
jgi:hypothetical protein